MQYKIAKKIIIDQHKLESLFRMGCPAQQIIELLKEKKFTPTGDILIDETLESLIDYKTFENWGGKRIGAGKKPKKSNKNNHLENQDEIQLENQDANQDANQVVDIDIDKDRGIDIGGMGGKGKGKGNNKPTLDDILSFAREQSAFSGCGGINIPDDIAKRFFDRYEKQNWCNENNMPIRDWKKLLIGWVKNEPKYKNPDIDDFLDSWNNHFVKSVKSVSQWAKADTATIDDVRALIPTAKQKLLAVIKTAQEKQKRGERPILPFKPTNNIWQFAVAILLKRRFYSDFLYNDCNITAKFFCNHITELANPYSTEYLNESEKHTHD